MLLSNPKAFRAGMTYGSAERDLESVSLETQFLGSWENPGGDRAVMTELQCVVSVARASGRCPIW